MADSDKHRSELANEAQLVKWERVDQRLDARAMHGGEGGAADHGEPGGPALRGQPRADRLRTLRRPPAVRRLA